MDGRGLRPYRRRRLAQGPAPAMRIMLVTDAWDPQVNGVVRTMKRVITECEQMGHTWDIVSPNGFERSRCRTYSEIKLAFGGPEDRRGALPRIRTRRRPHRNRGPARLGRPRRLPASQVSLHDRLPHALSRIHRGAVLLPARLDGLHVRPRISQILRPRHGRDGLDAR